MLTAKNIYPRKYAQYNVSLTTYRAVYILLLLAHSPLSRQEIIEELKKNYYTDRAISPDTVTLTVNALRKAGCKIERPTINNDYKYVLERHPFSVTFSDENIKFLVDVRDYFLAENDWKTVVDLNELYDKLYAICAKDDSVEGMFNYISRPFAKINPDIMSVLRHNDLTGKEVFFDYQNSASRRTQKNVLVKEVYCRSNRLYLLGWYFEKQCFASFNADKIVKINSIKDNDTQIPQNSYTAVYLLTGTSTYSFRPDSNETILEESDEMIKVKVDVTDEFYFFQRLLSFGTDFTLVSPESSRIKLAEKLEKILEKYKDR